MNKQVLVGRICGKKRVGVTLGGSVSRSVMSNSL